MIQGSSSQIQVYVTSIGKAEDVTLSCNAGLIGVNCTFEPAIGKSSFNSTLTVAVSDSTPAGNYSVTIIASGGGRAVNVSSILSVLSADVTVSGQASSAGIYQPFPSSLIGIQFTDIQIGAKTSFSFPSTFPLSINPFGNYSVHLMNKHTYNVTLSYYGGPSPGNMSLLADNLGNFTVNAPAGETAIVENFP